VWHFVDTEVVALYISCASFGLWLILRVHLTQVDGIYRTNTNQRQVDIPNSGKHTMQGYLVE
jgi:hypothetical protein